MRLSKLIIPHIKFWIVDLFGMNAHNLFFRVNFENTTANVNSNDIILIVFESDSSNVGPGFTLHFEG